MAKRNKEFDVTMKEYLDAKMELEQLRKEHGIETPPEEEGKITQLINRHYERKENRVKYPCSKKTYLWLAILLGWCGGHRYYAHQWIVAVLYSALFWTGIPIAMTIIDLLVVIPIEANNEGIIEI